MMGKKWEHTHQQEGGALIVGDTLGIGREFARLILADDCPVILADHREAEMRLAKHKLQHEFEHSRVHLIIEDITTPDAGVLIYDASLMYQILATPPFKVSLLINILEFRSPDLYDPWVDGLEPTYNLESLLTLAELYQRDMLRMEQGEIINVLVKPVDQDPFLDTIYQQTESILLEYLNLLNADGKVKIHTLSFTPRKLQIRSQTDNLAVGMSHDNHPHPYSAGQAADFGYQAMRRSRNA